jgi:hypothetical protein
LVEDFVSYEEVAVVASAFVEDFASFEEAAVVSETVHDQLQQPDDT